MDVYPARFHRGEVQIDADAVPSLPEHHDTGYLDRWARRHDEQEPYYGYLQGLQYGPPVSAMRSRKQLTPQWDEVLLLPGQLAHPPRLASEPLSLRTVLGRRGGAAPRPRRAVLRIAHVVRRAVGEREDGAGAHLGGPRERHRVWRGRDARRGARPSLDGDPWRWRAATSGWSPEQIARADAVEIKIGQSAKAGSGGLLPADKVTPRIAEVRGLQAGEAAHSPARFTDIHSLAELRTRIEEIREHLDGGPVGIKFAAGRVEEDLDAAIEAGVDFVTIDGRGGGTGAAPEVLKDHLTLPIQYALHRATAHLAARGIDDLDIVGDGPLPDRRGRDEGDRDGRDGGGAGDRLDGRESGVSSTSRATRATARSASRRSVRTSRHASTSSSRASADYVRSRRSARRSSCCAARSASPDIHDLTTSHLATLDSEIAAHTSIRHA